MDWFQNVQVFAMVVESGSFSGYYRRRGSVFTALAQLRSPEAESGAGRRRPDGFELEIRQLNLRLAHLRPITSLTIFRIAARTATRLA